MCTVIPSKACADDIAVCPPCSRQDQYTNQLVILAYSVLLGLPFFPVLLLLLCFLKSSFCVKTYILHEISLHLNASLSHQKPRVYIVYISSLALKLHCPVFWVLFLHRNFDAPTGFLNATREGIILKILLQPYLFIQEISIKYVECARHCLRCQGYRGEIFKREREKKKKVPALKSFLDAMSYAMQIHNKL